MENQISIWLSQDADSNEGGHLFQSHRGHHSNLMAATIPISSRPGWHRLEARFWSCHRGAVWVKRQCGACVKAARKLLQTAAVYGALVASVAARWLNVGKFSEVEIDDCLKRLGSWAVTQTVG